jgi:hypothetical protein
MLDLRTNQWLTRLQSAGPNLVSWALAILIVAQLASLAISVLSGSVKSPQPLVARSAPPRPAAGVDVQAVVAAHLFGIAVADPTVQDPANAPLSSANLVLAGTIATGDPKHGIAIISDGGPAKVFSVGDNVAGATLHSVYLDHVIRDAAAAAVAERLQAHSVGAPWRGRSTHGRGRRQHPPPRAAGSGTARPGDAHRCVVRQCRRQTARLSRLSRQKSRDIQQTGFETRRFGHGN